jgi:cellobiose phosphorylase
VEAHGWDGEWFLRAYDAFGHKVGTHETEEAQIYIEPQGFAVMAGIGRDNGMALKALDSTRNILFGPWGVEILHPVYTKYHVELGEITSYPGGYKENGSVFTHNNPWVGIAEAMMGRANESFEVYTRICPAWVEENSDIRKISVSALADELSEIFGECRSVYFDIEVYDNAVLLTPNGRVTK